MKQRTRIILSIILVLFAIYVAIVAKQVVVDLLGEELSANRILWISIVIYIGAPLLTITHIMDKIGKNKSGRKPVDMLLGQNNQWVIKENVGRIDSSFSLYRHGDFCELFDTLGQAVNHVKAIEQHEHRTLEKIIKGNI